jgi:AraC-like DNA-binding protein
VVSRFQFESRDPDESAELLSIVAPGVNLRKLRTGSFVARARGAALPMLGLFEIGLGHAKVIVPEGLDYFSLTLPLQGSLEVVDASRAAAVTPGRMHLQPPGKQFDLRKTEPGSTLVANLDADLIERHLDPSSHCKRRVPLPSVLDLGGGRGTTLLRYLEFVWRDVQNSDSAFHSPLVATEAAMLTAAMLADVIGEVTRTDADEREGGQEPDALRRAKEYMAARVSRPTALADVAEAAGVSVRTLSRTFQKHHGMGPIHFLIERRFEATRSALLYAEPDDVSVTEVALRYGFGSPGRFAVQYRSKFGESPSETLARESSLASKKRRK